MAEMAAMTEAPAGHRRVGGWKSINVNVEGYKRYRFLQYDAILLTGS